MLPAFLRGLFLFIILCPFFAITAGRSQETSLLLRAIPADEPLPPDSVTAVILGPDSAIYISWLVPQTTLTVETYDIYRLSGFDPEGDPTSGTQTLFLSHNWPACVDPSWPSLGPGWYAYGVRALYTNGQVSITAVSNIVGHMMHCNVKVQVTLATNEPATDARVHLFGKDYPYMDYAGRDSSLVNIDSVIKSTYTVAAYHTGYDTSYLENVSISQDTLLELQLHLKTYPPYNLYVDSVSLIATWHEPGMIAVREDFENPIFPPPGWQALTKTFTGWFRTRNGSSGGFTIPPWDSFYACANVEIGASLFHMETGSTGNHCCDYLITPPLDLTESDSYQLVFDSFYNGAYGHSAYIEYSHDNGETWDVFYQLMPYATWHTLQLELETLAGPDATQPVWLAFHSDDNGIWASGWAIDNVWIHDPSVTIDYESFNVYLDDSLLAQTSGLAYSYAPLNYGQRHLAAVSANYSHGVSRKDTFSFTSRYLPPPLDLAAAAGHDSVYLSWDPPDTELTARAVDSIVPVNLLGYNIYRDEIPVGYQPHAGAYVTQTYIDAGLEPGHYLYTVTGIYDLGLYGFPGDTGQSVAEGPADVTIDYCHDLEFLETWAFGNFDTNQWESEGPNWVINGQAGNPAPSAEYRWDPIQADYAFALESYPLCATGMTEGRIMLDFDLKLNAYQATGEEFLKVEVWNWDSPAWITVKEFSNVDGSFDWISESINIGAQATGKVFKVRFVATGVNSLNIVAWNLDNIHVYRVCESPANLISTNQYYNTVILNWEAPSMPPFPSNHKMVEPAFALETDRRELTSFNIYRSKDGSDYELTGNVSETTYKDTNLENGIYCYMVSALWEGETGDVCESGMSNESCENLVGIGDPGATEGNRLSIFPNPARRVLRVKVLGLSSGIDCSLVIYDIFGRVASARIPVIIDPVEAGDGWQADVSPVPAGIYLAVVQDERSVIGAGKFIVTR